MLKVGSNADSPFPGSELNKYRSIALGVGGLVFGALLFGSLAKVDVVVTGDGSVSPDFLDYTLSALMYEAGEHESRCHHRGL